MTMTINDIPGQRVRRPGGYTPRNMRRKGNDFGATRDTGKTAAFARAKQWSDRFIHQKASQLAKEPLASAYREWNASAGFLRKSGGKGK